MKFSTRSDVEAPISYVFDQLSDFTAFERLALTRGAEMVRTDALERAAPGARWQTSFHYRGKQRQLDLVLEEYDRPGHMRFDLTSKNVAGAVTVELDELPPGHTRVELKVQIEPRTMSARVLVHSLSLAKTRATRRMQTGLETLAGEIEMRFRQPEAPA